MVDPGLTLAGLSAPLLYKLLGPTADYLGGELRDNLAQRREDNVGRIFQKSVRKLGGPHALDEDMEVPARVLAGIINEGSFCDDELVAEYFGGVLAASRTPKGDDRGVYYIDVIKGLSTYQLRSHYILYTIFHRLIKRQQINIDFSSGTSISSAKVLVLAKTYINSMDIPEGANDLDIAAHSLGGLKRTDLIGGFIFGNSKEIKKIYMERYPDFVGGLNEAALLWTPSMVGVEFYLWGNGFQNTPPAFTESLIPELDRVQIESGSSLTT